MNEYITMEQFIYIACSVIGFISLGILIIYFDEKRKEKRKAERFSKETME